MALHPKPQFFQPPVNVTSRLLMDMPDDPSMASLRHALEKVATIAGEVVSHQKTVLIDTSTELNERGQKRKIRDYGDSALIGADKILGNALEKADGEFTKLETELAKALPALDEGSHGAEVRAHIKSLPERKRREFLLSAQANDDTATVAAALTAASFLSGLTDADLDVIRNRRSEAVAKANPKLARRIEALRTARDRVQLARQSLKMERQRAFGDASASVAV